MEDSATPSLKSLCLYSGMLLLLGARLIAAPVQFTVDPAQSHIALSGNAVGSTLSEQGPGSLSTTFSGTLVADVTGNTIQFTGGSALAAQTNGVWKPGAGGSSGSAPADYGAQATTFIGSIKGALRNLLLDATSSVLPISNGQFDASALIFSFPTNSTASFDYDAGFLGSDGIALSGYSTNKIVNGATLDATGKLTIQIDTEFKFGAITDNDSLVHLIGQLVATSGGGGVTNSFTITSIAVQNQTVTLHVQGAKAGAALQGTTDFKSWNPQNATRSDDGTGAVFTFPAAGAADFFRVSQ